MTKAMVLIEAPQGGQTSGSNMPYGAILWPAEANTQTHLLSPLKSFFALSPRYGIRTARDPHDWFLSMMREHDEFEVETHRVGEQPLSFWRETVRWVIGGVSCECLLRAAGRAQEEYDKDW